MTNTLKVGDKVSYEGFGTVELTYGPFVGTFGDEQFLVRRTDGREIPVPSDELTPLPKFAVGDKVTTGRAEFTVEAGPFQGYGEWYAIRQEDGKVVSSAGLGAFTKVEPAREIKVGDRVRVTDDDGGGGHRFNGRVGTVVGLHGPHSDLPYKVKFGNGRGFHGDLNGTWNCRAVELLDSPAGTETVDGVVYDLNARYSDNDGDVWKFKKFPDGEVRGTYGRREVHDYDEKLKNVVRSYGPLTRVTT
ncbi:phiSA1p31-related protein [Streptomyces bikiniensis]|uniref:PhiSA1p31-related protein n=1 Tax=Streptomyces bikiniensis TaxID=1896 RepID=A0ABW8D3B5_STRBI